MTRRLRALAPLLAATLVPGCASAPTASRPVTLGRTVSVEMDADKAKVNGELLLVGKDRVWVRAQDGVREIPLAGVREVRVKRHDLGGRKVWSWVAAGAIVSGVGMSVACSRESSDCASVGLVTGGLWLLLGAPAAWSLEKSSRIEYPHPAAETLRPYARLPQGLAPGVTPAMLAKAPPSGPKAPNELRK